MLRATKPGGLIVWYDFVTNNPRNADVRGVPRTELKRLFAGCAMSAERITLAPPVARFVAPRSRPLLRLLNAIPFLRTHCLAFIRTPETNAR